MIRPEGSIPPPAAPGANEPPPALPILRWLAGIVRAHWLRPSPTRNGYARRVLWLLVGGALCPSCRAIVAIAFGSRPLGCRSCGVPFLFWWPPVGSKGFRPPPDPRSAPPLGADRDRGAADLTLVPPGEKHP
jgi:hypothetical protein